MVKTGIFCFLFIWPSERLGRDDDFQGSDSSFFFMRILFFKNYKHRKNTVKNYFIFSEKKCRKHNYMFAMEMMPKGRLSLRIL